MHALNHQTSAASLQLSLTRTTSLHEWTIIPTLETIHAAPDVVGRSAIPLDLVHACVG